MQKFNYCIFIQALDRISQILDKLLIDWKDELNLMKKKKNKNEENEENEAKILENKTNK
jgi:hypothetical protein